MKFLTLLLILSTPSFARDLGPGHGAGPAHPSAFICQQEGGKSVGLYVKNLGEAEGCYLGQSLFSPMSLYYFKKVKVSNVYDIFMNPPEVPSEARKSPEKYCRAIGGVVEEAQLTPDLKKVVAICQYAVKATGQRSAIGLVTLFRGAKDPRNAALVNLLERK